MLEILKFTNLFQRMYFANRICITSPKVILQHLSRRQSFCTKPEARSEEQHTGVKTLQRSIAKTKEEVLALQQAPFEQPVDPRQLRVAIIGLPNVGKSTLINQFMSWKICAVSSKVHTTQHKSRIIMVDGNTQIVFLDTPGILDKDECAKYNLNSTLLMDPAKSLNEADLIAVITDVATKYRQAHLDAKIVHLLKKHQHKPSVLILNKIDKLKKKEYLLDITRQITDGKADKQDVLTRRYGKRPVERIDMEKLFDKYEKRLTSRQIREQVTVGKISDELQMLNESSSKDAFCKPEAPDKSLLEEHVDPFAGMEDRESKPWPHFDRVFMISALTSDGVDDIKEYFKEIAIPDKWRYNPAIVTDQSPFELTTMTIRDKLLEQLPKEIPYKVKTQIDMWQVDEHGVLRIAVAVYCHKKNVTSMILGPNGDRIKRIAGEARQDLMDTFRCEVSLKLIVKTESKNKA